MTATVTPVRSRLRIWAVAALAAGTLLGGGALAFAGSPAAKSTNNQTGQTGASPVPLTDVVHGKTKFRVASFNILGYDHTEAGGKGGGQKSGYADGALRMKWAIQELKTNDVDVVGLQEFQPEQYAKWMKRATNTYDIWPGFQDTDGFLRNSIAWRKDKFRLVTGTWVKLPYFKGDVLRMPVALLQNVATGQQFYVMNFQNPADVRGNANKWRLQGQRVQIALVNQLRASNQLPIIWTGDMNAKQQVFCRVTAEAGMVSASGGYRDASSCQPPAGMVVDWIFGSGVTFKKYEQVRDKKIARTTDHHLVTSKVRIEATGAVVPPAPVPTTTCTTQTPTPTPYPTTASTPVVLPPSSSATPSPTPTATVSPSTTYYVTPTPSPTTVCSTTTPVPVIFPTAP